MKVLFAVPSKNRALSFRSWSWLQFIKKHDVKIFLESQDVKAYSHYIPKSFIVRLPQSHKGLGYAKKQIQKYAVENGYDFIFKIDDDVKGWCGPERGVSRKNEAAAELVEHFIAEYVLPTFEKYKDLAGVGFPYRNEMFVVQKWLGINERLQTCYITRTDSFYPDERISVFEDFATFLKIRLHNTLTLRYGWAGMDCLDVGENKGGHQDFNRNELAKKELNILRRWHPALTFKRTKGKVWEYEPFLRDRMLFGKSLQK